MQEQKITRGDILLTLRRVKSTFENRYGVVRIGVFGSVARNEAGRGSDVDIVVEMTPNLFKRAALKTELESLLGKPVDVVRYRPKMDHRLRQRIDNEAIYA